MRAELTVVSCWLLVRQKEKVEGDVELLTRGPRRMMACTNRKGQNLLGPTLVLSAAFTVLFRVQVASSVSVAELGWQATFQSARLDLRLGLHKLDQENQYLQEAIKHLMQALHGLRKAISRRPCSPHVVHGAPKSWSTAEYWMQKGYLATVLREWSSKSWSAGGDQAGRLTGPVGTGLCGSSGRLHRDTVQTAREVRWPQTVDRPSVSTEA